jgi:hypothetical protein
VSLLLPSSFSTTAVFPKPPQYMSTTHQPRTQPLDLGRRCTRRWSPEMLMISIPSSNP